jgi:hypothetical protein
MTQFYVCYDILCIFAVASVLLLLVLLQFVDTDVLTFC